MMPGSFRLALCCLVWACAINALAQHTHQHSAGAPSASAASASPNSGKAASPTAPAKACRKGSFTDAMALINASVRASRNLAQTGNGKSTVAMAELDAIAGIAIEQASAEFDCVQGTLVLGYDQNFADTARLAWNHAKARKMSPIHIQQAQQLISTIEQTGAPATTRAKK